MLPNYPNPFNPQTIIRFYLPEEKYIVLTIYSVTGEKLITMIDGIVAEGYHEVVWNGINKAASGWYFCVLQGSDQLLVRKMMLLR